VRYAIFSPRYAGLKDVCERFYASKTLLRSSLRHNCKFFRRWPGRWGAGFRAKPAGMTILAGSRRAERFDTLKKTAQRICVLQIDLGLRSLIPEP
jgi:hypothetical protein